MKGPNTFQWHCVYITRKLVCVYTIVQAMNDAKLFGFAFLKCNFFFFKSPTLVNQGKEDDNGWG